MANRTVTRTIETDVEPAPIYLALVNVRLLPRWAPVFADTVEHVDGPTYRVTKDGGTFSMQLISNKSSMTVDYLREMGDGVRGGAYIRVIPQILGGSVITMTVPVGPSTSSDQVAVVLEQELEALIKLT
jgi:hypothetical protein